MVKKTFIEVLNYETVSGNRSNIFFWYESNRKSQFSNNVHSSISISLFVSVKELEIMSACDRSVIYQKCFSVDKHQNIAFTNLQS